DLEARVSKAAADRRSGRPAAVRPCYRCLSQITSTSESGSPPLLARLRLTPIVALGLAALGLARLELARVLALRLARVLALRLARVLALRLARALAGGTAVDRLAE